MGHLQRPFRFCLLTNGSATRSEWIENAIRTEDLGYDALLFGDHVHNSMAPSAAMATAAGATHHLRIGSYLYGNDFRHPLMLAQEAATIDVLSEGRLDFGIGTGYLFYDYQQLGLPLDSPAVRIERLEEGIKLVKSYFVGQPFEYQGKYYRSTVNHFSATPVQKPHPPILMGGGGKKMLSLAAREADVVSLNPRTTPQGWFDFSSLSVEATNKKMNWIWEAAGDRAGKIEISIIIPLVKITKNDSETTEQANGLMRNFNIPEDQLTLTQCIESPHMLVGSLEAVEKKLLANRERFGLSHYVFMDPSLASQEIVKRLSGK